MMQVICSITNMIRGGQLAGLFVIKAFTDTCNHQHTNSSLRLFHPNVVMFSSTIITVAPTFRENVMNIVYSIISKCNKFHHTMKMASSFFIQI